MSIESVKSGYEKTRKRHGGASAQEQITYDLNRLVDATWNLKVFMELFASKTRRLGKMMKHDSFYLVITCSRRINGNAELRKRPAGFLDCWVSFIEILETMSIKAEELSDELALSLARILFIAALVFDMPEKPNIENIISDPNARRLNGTFPASIHDIEFSKTLPGDLKGPFESGADIFMNLRANLYFYLAKMG